VRVELTLDDDRQFQPSRKVTLSGKFGERQAEIEFFRRQHGRCVLKLQGIDSISDAEKYVGADVRIPTNELLPPEEGSFYTFQLKGCRVFSAGEELGTVVDVLDLGGTTVLQVGQDRNETLIPFASSYLKKIDLNQRRIDVDLPEGLKELNR
jgi:16S rRNA processing protein RimM